MIYDIPINQQGTTNIYIDDLTSVTVDVKGMDNLVRCDCAPLFAMNTCSHPLDPNEPIPCKTMEAMNKLHLEGLLQETKTILGWHIEFCQLLIKLPNNKFVAWTAAIEKMLGNRTSTAKTLKTNIGHLIHLGLAILFIHHFMSQLHTLNKKTEKRHMVKINDKYHKDLEMMLGFLKIANDGICMNPLTTENQPRLFLGFKPAWVGRIQP